MATGQNWRPNLNEAQLVLLKPDDVQLESIHINSKLDECSKCPFRLYKSLEFFDKKPPKFKLDTRYGWNLELRSGSVDNDDNYVICRLNSLHLDSQAIYNVKIVDSSNDVRVPAASTSPATPWTSSSSSLGSSTGAFGGSSEFPFYSSTSSESINDTLGGATSIVQSPAKYDCSIKNVMQGECYWCPLIAFGLILLLLSMFEFVWLRYCCRKRQQDDHQQQSTTHQNSLRHLRQGNSATTTTNPTEAHINSSAQPIAQSSVDGAMQLNAAARPVSISRQAQAHLFSYIDTSNSTINTQSEANLDPNEGYQDHQQDGAKRHLVSSSSTKGRVQALDAFRGLTIVLMIMVNYGGAGYEHLEHTLWDGISLADLVFPFFIFSMGASICLSINSHYNRAQLQSDTTNANSTPTLLGSIIKRSCLLFLIGVCLNSKRLLDNQHTYKDLRILGVLQRFGVSYLVVAFVYALELSLDRWLKARQGSCLGSGVFRKILAISWELSLASLCTAAYVYVTYLFQYDSNCPIGYLGPGGITDHGSYANCTAGASGWLDRKVFATEQLYQDAEVEKVFGLTKQHHDPEGLLGYTTSIVLTLIGLQCGKIFVSLRSSSKPHRRSLVLMFVAIVMLAILAVGLIRWNPLNKRLWSLSYVLATSSGAYATIALLYVVVDMAKLGDVTLVKLLLAAGNNSIFLYVGHSLVTNVLPWHVLIPDDKSRAQVLGRLLWAVFVWLLVAQWMAKRRLFIKV